MEEVVVRGIPTRVWKHAPSSLRAVFELSAAHGDKDFLVYEDERVTFRQHFATAATVGHELGHRFGVTKGDRVAIAMRNLPEWVVAFWAAVSVGAVVVPLNAWWTGPELAYGLEDSGASVLFTDEERAGRLAPHLDGRTADRRPTGRAPLGRRPVRRAGRLPGRPCGPPARRRRSGRRRHDLLHLGDDREAQGCGRDAPEQLLEPHEPLLQRHPGLDAGQWGSR
ncbi:MAG: AMP-binding protein [Acidimicrobiales bacterium]